MTLIAGYCSLQILEDNGIRLEDADLPDTKQSASLSGVVFKAPPFWEENPEFWFHQIESLFIIVAITSKSTEFHSVVAAWSSNFLL
ncbi:hypothetical protein NPIL_698111 [Nephila pilipes]|uniref:DUF7041 domain-containing protein n=1 Tax=Nephila pilipes TaxID=299642 RepID=A0A8X6QFV5_NEPPI|nr:hypothetical protein NPIL_626021 [Nephila pilipes]GFU11379.1 hypothetical protein NPIL_698111 [Nephila pilipes]